MVQVIQKGRQMSNFLAVNRRHFLFAAVPLSAAGQFQKFSREEARTVEALCEAIAYWASASLGKELR
jgi:hypothetical protein